MDATDLLASLTTIGVALRVDEGTLHASPRALLTTEIRDQIREHKTALMALLTPAPAIDDDPGPWQFHSQTLDADIWVCRTEADAAALKAEGVLAYLPEEIWALKAMQTRDPGAFPRKLRAIHLNRDVWEATLDSVELPAPAKEPA